MPSVRDRTLIFHGCPYCGHEFTRGVAEQAGISVAAMKERHTRAAHADRPARPWRIVRI